MAALVTSDVGHVLAHEEIGKDRRFPNFTPSLLWVIAKCNATFMLGSLSPSIFDCERAKPPKADGALAPFACVAVLEVAAGVSEVKNQPTLLGVSYRQLELASGQLQGFQVLVSESNRHRFLSCVCACNFIGGTLSRWLSSDESKKVVREGGLFIYDKQACERP